ncbi:nitrous oxide reductase accessory protein NosL [Hydrogenimonas urashimensis]|uniref:nitrous oxide reductase accessory protein NosL n=1 Tax=Hydrogenimonas urashimensis TaxID=2740515 RepID=UPI001916287A|nr:nitrous oxide reductase accessory protein NosL [Hydrogenimonas urashimensis]
MRRLLSVLMVVALGLFAAQNQKVKEEVAFDPVYGLPIGKYPKFEADVILKDGRTIRFCCVKAMLDFYYRPWLFPEFKVSRDRKEIERMIVRDYLDGTKTEAEKAWYVYGSRVAGPHGDDLIPLGSKVRAELFVKRYGGSRIMDFKTVKQKGFGLIDFLDSP